MSIRSLHISGYRSIRDLRLKLGRVNVVSGPNGCGKSNLYRAVRLLAESAHGRLARALAEEGGMPSVLWAGKRTVIEKPRVQLGVQLDDYSYELTLGLPLPKQEGDSDPSMFLRDPLVKEEALWHGHERRPSTTVLERKRSSATVRTDTVATPYPTFLDAAESAIAQLQEPHRYPELSVVQQRLRGWRFYHGFRTDATSPLRSPQYSVRTPILSNDGADLAAALRTIHEIGDQNALYGTIEEAFPGAGLRIQPLFSASDRQSAPLCLLWQPPGVKRFMEAAELSDGTLRFLCLAAALLSPRPPEFLVLNEPETSLHPDLFPALAGLIAKAARQSQIWVTTHARTLAEEIEKRCGEPGIRLKMDDEGETRIEGAEE